MKVNVEFLSLQLITQALGKKSLDVEFQGGSFRDLLHHLAGKVKRFGDVVMGPDGSVDYDIQVYINGETVQREEMDGRLLGEGDKVAFLLLLAGG